MIKKNKTPRATPVKQNKLAKVKPKTAREVKFEPKTAREVKSELEADVAGFVKLMLGKYTNYDSHNMRPQLARCLEQHGIGIHDEIEGEKRLVRDALVASNKAKEPPR